MPMLLAVLVAFALAVPGGALAQEPAAAARPLGVALETDGALRGDAAGAFDPSGYRLSYARDGAPRFTAAYGPDSCGHWDDQFGPQTGTTGLVRAVLVWDGDVYVAGSSLTRIGGVTVSNVARWDGAQWSSLGGGTNSGATVYALATDGTHLYAAGNFTSMGGTLAANLARWDGAGWSRIATTVNGSIFAMNWHAGSLYVAGAFTVVNGNVNAARIARWNGATWSAVGVGVNNSINTMTWRDDTLYVGGLFTLSGADTMSHVARWNGTAWSRVGTTLGGGTGAVHALVWGGDQLYAAGEFTIAAGGSIGRIARLDGTNWVPLGAGLNGFGYALSWWNGALYAGGNFTTAGGVAANGLARWDGAAWSAVGAGLANSSSGATALVRAFETDAVAGDLLVGGQFEGAGGIGGMTLRGVGRWNGVAWAPVSPSGNGLSGGAIGGVIANLGGADKLVVCGDFPSAGSVVASRVAAFDLATNTWEALGEGFNLSTRAVAVAFGQLYAAGLFTSSGGVAMSRLARWNGTSWSAVGAGANAGVERLAVAPNGDLYACGQFTSIGGVAANAIAKYDGLAWSALGTGLGNSVEDVAFGDDGNGGFVVYACGHFVTAGGLPAVRVAKWANGAWSAMGAGVDSVADAIVTVPRTGGGHDVYVGGWFHRSGADTVERIAHWTGATWEPVGAGFDRSVNYLGLLNGQLLAGGNFTVSGGDSLGFLATWDGAAWHAVGGQGMRGTYGLDHAVVTDTSLFAIGMQASAGCGTPSENLARLSLTTATTAVDDAPLAPGDVALAPASPNPFRGATTLAFRLAEPGHVSLRVHDVAGRVLATLADGPFAAGRHVIRFDAGALPHGVYFASLRADAGQVSRKLFVVK